MIGSNLARDEIRAKGLHHREMRIISMIFETCNNNNFIKMATIAVELYNWHSKTTNDNKLIKTKI